MWIETTLRIAMLTVAALGAPAADRVAAQVVPPPADVLMFSREGCPHCAAAKLFLADLGRRRPQLRFEIRDVARDTAALGALHALAAQHQLATIGVPTFVVNGHVLVGFQSAETTGRAIEARLPLRRESAAAAADACTIDVASADCAPDPGKASAIDLPVFGRLRVEEIGLPAITIAIGLIDGFNPCAMWVLLFLLSILVGLRNRARMFAIGGVFVLTSGVAYFAFMAAWLNVFLLIGMVRWVQVTLGLVAIGMALLNLKDFVAFGRGFSLGIPQSAKPGLYARTRALLRAQSLPATLLAAAVLAALVNVIELVCTAGLPAVYTQILSLQGVDTFGRYAYLGLYNLAYMADDVLMLTIAVVTLSSRRLQERGARGLKFVSGAVMLVLGLVLIVRPGWLAF